MSPCDPAYMFSLPCLALNGLYGQLVAAALAESETVNADADSFNDYHRTLFRTNWEHAWSATCENLPSDYVWTVYIQISLRNETLILSIVSTDSISGLRMPAICRCPHMPWLFFFFFSSCRGLRFLKCCKTLRLYDPILIKIHLWRSETKQKKRVGE